MSNTDLPVGQPAPDFALPDGQGGEVRLSAYCGQPVILFFTRAFG